MELGGAGVKPLLDVSKAETNAPCGQFDARHAIFADHAPQGLKVHINESSDLLCGEKLVLVADVFCIRAKHRKTFYLRQ
jgi:hypothetical protein